MMKRILVCLLTIALSATCLCAQAFADSIVKNSYVLEARSVEFNRYTNTMGVVKSDTKNYVLIDAAGNELTTAPYVHMRCNMDMYEVAVDTESDNALGLIDSAGNEIIPMQYGDIQYISPHWQLGVSLEKATVDNYDYKSWDGENFYLVSAYDVYFNGKMVGSLSRTQYDYAYGYGDYLYMEDKEGNYSYYDSAFNKSACASDGSSEYSQDYKTNAFWHKGSNQQAFAPGCTLTSDEVEQSIMELNGQFYDLQGNVLFRAANAYDYSISYEGDYARVHAFGKYGLIDKEGNEVVPCEYDQIYCSERYLDSGYQVVVKDGKVGYVNVRGEVTCDFVYGESNVYSTYRSPFNYLNDLEGNVIVLSGAIGELPERYASVRFGDGDCCPVFAAVNLNGDAGVVDLYGNTVIGFNGAYDDEYDFSISNDGSLVLGYMGSGEYEVYQLERTDSAGALPAAADAPAEPVTADAPAAAEAPAEEAKTDAPEGWNCASCGAANAGKFCTNCGAAKPVEEVKPECKNCGYAPAPGEKPNFCPECGTAFEY